MRFRNLTFGAVLTAVLAAGCGGSEGEVSLTPTQPPASSPSPITASGKVAYINTDGNLALMNPDGSGVEALTDGGGIEGLRWSPDGSLIAVEGGEGAGFGLRVIGADGGLSFELGDASTPVWSPLGDRLVVSEGSSIAVYDLGGSRLLEVPNATGAEWSPDGKTLAFLRPEEVAGGKAVPLLVDVSSGQERPLSDQIEADEPIYPILWHPAGELIAYRDSLYDPATGEKEDLPGVASFWSPDGRLLLVTLGFDAQNNSTTAHLLDFSQGQPIIGLEVRPTAEVTPAWLYIHRWTAWSPDSRYLVYIDPDPFRPRVRIYDTVAVTQDILRDIKGERPSVSPDGRHAAFMFEGKVWILALDGSVLQDVSEGSYPAWQPGG